MDEYWYIAILVIFYCCKKIGERAGKKTVEAERKRWMDEQQKELELFEDLHKEVFQKYTNFILEATYEERQNAPWAAQQVADFFELRDKQIADKLRYKSRPAIKAANEVSKIKKEKHALNKKCKMLEYQLAFYENAFPWLENYKELSAKDAWEYAKGINTEETSEYERIKNWLSPEEYQNLPTSEKYQLALNRYMRRSKTNWEVGIDYERFVGYKFEERGFKVKYCGALLGLEDMGRDLIATIGTKAFVVQCKRWAQEKVVHEKHIFQLYGSVVLLSTKNSKTKYQGLFITTATLSDVAKSCADYLGVKYIENYKMEQYPLVKCNISKSGEKIYHLPFDQQYDRVEISTKENAFYTQTVAEAEQLGFRRAYRWNPNKHF